jgi:hypothetical protein
MASEPTRASPTAPMTAPEPLSDAADGQQRELTAPQPVPVYGAQQANMAPPEVAAPAQIAQPVVADVVKEKDDEKKFQIAASSSARQDDRRYEHRYGYGPRDHGRLPGVRMRESSELLGHRHGNINDALLRAAANGRADVVDYLIRYAMFDPSCDGNFAILLAVENGHLAVVERLLQDERVDPSADGNLAIRLAAGNGHLAVVERLLQDKRVDPSAEDNPIRGAPVDNDAVRRAAEQGHLAVVERLLQDERVDPSADGNDAVQMAARNGHLAVVDRLLLDKRVDPSSDNNNAVRWAAINGHLAVVDQLLEDDRVDAAVAIQHTRPEHCKRFECRERLTEICIALQDLALPAWVTIKILDAARPWSTLPLHSKWNLVCAVKHFHDKHPDELIT